MSVPTRARCPHKRGAFVWLGDGPWLGDPTDPDYGRYPYVHDTSTSPGHLDVCDLMAFATAEECGELCACGCSSEEHPSTGQPIPYPLLANPRPCSCGCPDFEHRPEDLARWREAGLLGANRLRAGETAPQPPGEHDLAARLSEGESVPGGPGACAREGCAHLTLWHGRPGRFRDGPCRQCPCPAFTVEAGQVMPAVQLELFGAAL